MLLLSSYTKNGRCQQFLLKPFYTNFREHPPDVSGACA